MHSMLHTIPFLALLVEAFSSLLPSGAGCHWVSELDDWQCLVWVEGTDLYTVVRLEAPTVEFASIPASLEHG